MADDGTQPATVGLQDDIDRLGAEGSLRRATFAAVALLLVSLLWYVYAIQEAPEPTPSARTAGEAPVVVPVIRPLLVPNSKQTVRIEIFDRRGESRIRDLVLFVRPGGEGGLECLARFTAPPDLSGVGFLNILGPPGVEEQWLNFPEGDILNRISGSGRRGSFMGTDFSFEDLSLQLAGIDLGGDWGAEEIEVDDTRYSVRSVRVPQSAQRPGYSKVVAYVDSLQGLTRRVDFFDKTGSLRKRLSIIAFEETGDWVFPTHLVMENLPRETRTEVRVTHLRANVPAGEMPTGQFTGDGLRL